MTHKYIDIDKFRDFTRDLTVDDVIRDIRDKYKITNINDDDGESLWYICKALYDDFRLKRVNYMAFIEKDMDARMLMELRRSAVIQYTTDPLSLDYYRSFRKCETPDDVIKNRTKIISYYNEDYEDLDWQYYFLCMYTFRPEQKKNFEFNYESCFADGYYTEAIGREYYKEQFIQAHLPQYLQF